jgi:hypothetical protein
MRQAWGRTANLFAPEPAGPAQVLLAIRHPTFATTYI